MLSKVPDPLATTEKTRQNKQMSDTGWTNTGLLLESTRDQNGPARKTAPNAA